jgi:hypothetical protein
MLSRPCLGPPDPRGPPRGQNIAYDLALVKLSPRTKFGEDWSNGVYFYTGHTHTHPDSPLYIIIKLFYIKMLFKLVYYHNRNLW